MPLIGSIEHFDIVNGDFEMYTERMEQLFIVNKVEDAAKGPLYITLIGPDAYRLLKTLLRPANPTTKSYVEMVNVLKLHFKSATSIIAERYKFNKRVQKPEESVTEFIIILKEMAALCDFGEFLNDALRDRLVCGLLNESSVRLLLLEPNLTFDRACQMALNKEMSDNQSRVMLSAVANQIRTHSKSKEQKNTITSKFNQVSPWSQSNSKNQSRCGRCGRFHNQNVCPAREWECFSCKRKGHTSKVCRSRKVKSMEAREELLSDEEEIEIQELNKLVIKSVEGHCEMKENEEGRQDFNLAVNMLSCSQIVNLIIEDRSVDMEVDTGASISVIAEGMFEKLFPNIVCKQSKLSINSVSGEKLTVKGEILVRVKVNSKIFILPLVIIKSKAVGIPLLGRNWLDKIVPNWRLTFQMINKLDSPPGVGTDFLNIKNIVETFKVKYPNVFNSNETNHIAGFEAKLIVKDNVTKIFHKAYSVPYSLRDKVNSQLREMVKENILLPVRQSEIASPIVIVPKKNGTLRICGDFKKTLNPILKTDHYPLPTLEDMFFSVSGGILFTVLDLKNAYLQLPVNKQSQELLTINTSLGLFQYTRLPYGVSSSPAIFQSIMEECLKGLDFVAVYLDDVIISGKTVAECVKNVNLVLERFNVHNIKINLEKSVFFQEEIEFLGHHLSKQGIKPLSSKIREIEEAPAPQNVTQLKSFLGLLNFYMKFVPRLSEACYPLNELLKKKVTFVWSKKQQESFDRCKLLLANCFRLAHYDPSKPLIVAADASPYGLGALLSQVVDGEAKPIMCASCTLTEAEKNYAQVQREALAVIFAVKKFHKHLYGRKFFIYSDHQPLRAIFGEKSRLPTLAHARMQRWAVILSAYDYELCYKKASDMSNVDALSRLPLSDIFQDMDEQVFSFTYDDTLPITAVAIAEETKRDRLLTKVISLIKRGWNLCNEEELKPYFLRRQELSVENECLTWGNRVIVPQSLREELLLLLHDGHPGIVRMKLRARGDFWWPKLNDDIETLVNKCEACQTFNTRERKVEIAHWPKSHKNFDRIHLDFFKVNQIDFLLIFDSTSKWLEIFVMNGTNADKTIEKLRKFFCTFGLPQFIVADNGPPFNSEQFHKFCKSNGIQVINTPPYHPESNGSAEKAVSTIKRALKKTIFEENMYSKCKNLEHKLDNFLFNYRNTPSSVTKKSPAEIIFCQLPRTKLNMIHPQNLSQEDSKYGEQNTDTKEYKTRRRNIIYTVNQKVLVYLTEERKWARGEIMKSVGINSYLVLVNGRIRYIHGDHLKKSGLQEKSIPSITEMEKRNLEARPTEKSLQSDRSIVKPLESGMHEYSTLRRNSDSSTLMRNSDSEASFPLCIQHKPENENTNHETETTNTKKPSISEPTPTRKSQRNVRPPIRLNL